MRNRPLIVVLDGHTLNPGDLSWDALTALGECRIHARTATPDIVDRAHDASIVLTNKTPLTAATISALPDLRYIGVLATGYNIVDVAAARARGIPVANVPAYGTQSVAQHVLALLLELAQQTGAHAASVRAGRWAESADFCYWESPLIELAGKTLGIVGSGRIGTAVAKVAEALGMNVLFARRADGREALERVLRASDVVSLHCPLTDDTRHLINATTLSWLKPSAWLINTSRGPLIDEPALADALNQGKLGGAGLDVLSTEPPPRGHPLFTARNCLITPHIAWATTAARKRLMDTATANVRAFLEGRPTHVVN